MLNGGEIFQPLEISQPNSVVWLEMILKKGKQTSNGIIFSF
jgi:hypothetical protein